MKDILEDSHFTSHALFANAAFFSTSLNILILHDKIIISSKLIFDTVFPWQQSFDLLIVKSLRLCHHAHIYLTSNTSASTLLHLYQWWQMKNSYKMQYKKLQPKTCSSSLPRCLLLGHRMPDPRTVQVLHMVDCRNVFVVIHQLYRCY